MLQHICRIKKEQTYRNREQSDGYQRCGQGKWEDTGQRAMTSRYKIYKLYAGKFIRVDLKCTYCKKKNW